jgi:hypothetical protein
MAAFNERTVQITRHEYVLKSPAPWGEVGKAQAAASQAMKAAGKDPSYDDAAHIEARDDEVVIFWIEEKTL